jgi:hypothetical protein
MRFLGLAAPGAASLSSLDDLVSVWRLKNGHRFQNHRAIFTVLREELITKSWLEDLVQGVASADSFFCPAACSDKTGGRCAGCAVMSADDRKAALAISPAILRLPPVMLLTQFLS